MDDCEGIYNIEMIKMIETPPHIREGISWNEWRKREAVKLVKEHYQLTDKQARKIRRVLDNVEN